MLRAADVYFTYGGAPVLTGVSLDVRAGRIAGILGPNGSGKSTLLKLLAGTLRPGAGTVSFDGRPLSDIPREQLARRLAVVPQDTHLAFDYTALEIVLMGRYPHLGPFEVEGPRDLRIARDALAATGTAEFERRPFTTLSGGERQRVVIASALAQVTAPTSPTQPSEPPPRAHASSALLLDEPTAALDLGYQLETAALLRELNAARGLTMAISTHDLAFAAAVCHELILLRAGGVIAAGTPGDVLTEANILALYDVEAQVSRDAASGRVIVVPRRHIRR